MVLIEQDPVMMLTTSITATTRMLSVLAYASMSSTNMTTLLPILPQTCKTDMSFKHILPVEATHM
jgi:hypothetical protein